MDQENQIINADALQKADSRIKNSSNKSLFKVRLLDPEDPKKRITFLTGKLEKLYSYVEFIGYEVRTKIFDNITTFDELNKIAQEKDLKEEILTVPWWQVVYIKTIKAQRKETSGK